MACDRFWTEPPGAPSDGLRAHAGGCEDCRALLEAFADDGPEALPPGLDGSARAELAAHPIARPWWVGALGLAAAWLGILFALVHPWTGRVLAPAYGPVGLALAVGLVAAFFAAGLFALSPRRGLAVFGALVGVGAALGALLAAGQGGGGWFSGTGDCPALEVVSSALPLAVAVLLLRRFAFSWPRALAGAAAAGGVGVVLLQLACPNATVGHVVSAHLVPWAVTCAVAVGVRWRLRSASFAP